MTRSARLGDHPGLERRGDARRDRRLGAGAELSPTGRCSLVDDGSTDGSRGAGRAARGGGSRASACSAGRRTPARRRRATAASARRGGASSPSSTPTTSGGRRSSRGRSHFMTASGHPLVFTAYRRIAADGTPLGIVRAPARVSRAGLLKGNVIGCLTAVYDTAVFGKVEMPRSPAARTTGCGSRCCAAAPHAHGHAGGARRLPGAAGTRSRPTSSAPPAPPGRSTARPSRPAAGPRRLLFRALRGGGGAKRL